MRTGNCQGDAQEGVKTVEETRELVTDGVQQLRVLLRQSVLGYATKALQICRLAWRDLRTNHLGQVFPLKPTTLNLMVNDICNSHCEMCLIWKRKRDKELSAQELASILADPLYSKIRYIGVSGGEPTLRRDLAEIYGALVQKRPPIHGTGIITNALRKDDVVARILESSAVCRAAGIPFNVMVSLDGIGDVHDQVRGQVGNFESAVEVVRYFRDHTELPVSIGCTVTKTNVWHVDEVLDFCKAEGVYGRFRVAEFIRRLYNEEQKDCIRKFTESEAYHLGLFFAKLEYTYEKSPTVARTYRNIRRMLLEGAERSIMCPYQSTAVMLDCRGQLAYCAPQSPVLGSCLEESAARLFLRNLSTRRQIARDSCPSCIHDYHAEGTLAEWWSARQDRGWRRRLSLDGALAQTEAISFTPDNAGGDSAPRHVLIVGWFGTETAGDKAILGETIHQIRGSHPQSHIVLSSLYPYISDRTLQELGYPDVDLIPAYSAAFWQYTKAADEIIMAGGPLMHLEELGLVLWAFLRAKQAGHCTRILGCGIGPLDRGQKYWDAVRRILSLSDTIELRDSASVSWAKNMTGRQDILNSGDPAVGFVRRWMRHHPVAAEAGSFLNLYLREWTDEYQGALTDQQFLDTRARFEEQLGLWIRALCSRLALQPRLIPMHSFCIGKDDRDFNRDFGRVHLAGFSPIVEKTPFSAQEVLASFREATIAICMRFHSVVFAHTLGVRFFAIDYTGGGKIAGYLSDHNCREQMLSLQQIAVGDWRRATRIRSTIDRPHSLEGV